MISNEMKLDFWVRQFTPRTKKWCRETLKRLNKSVSIFEDAEENRIKKQALKFVLSA